MPAWALTPRRAGFWAFALSAGLKRTLAAVQWLWVASIVAAALALAWSWILKGRAWLEREQAWSALKWILAASLILNVAGVWWGLPGGSWAPDELTPTLVIGGATRGFSNGWFDRYPPFHYYMLTLAFSPLLLLERLGRVDLGAVTPYALLALIGRLVSVAAGVGTLLAIYTCGARAFGKRAGVLAAAMFAVVTPFVYYAKTANLDVPYLFWFALSMVCYLRLLDGLALRDFIGLAACATLAICTKDQAYGLYLLMPLAIVHRMWQANREAGERHPLWRALFDRRLRWAAIVALVLFACVHNVAFNARGFWEHVRFITGASETYRDFEPSLVGRIGLFRLTVDIIRMAWGGRCSSSASRGSSSPSSAPRTTGSRGGSPGPSCRTTWPSSTSCSTTTTASCCRFAWCCRCSVAWPSIGGWRATAVGRGASRARRRCSRAP
jgi:hypothetical protein